MDASDSTEPLAEWENGQLIRLPEPEPGDVFLVHFSEKVKERRVTRTDGEDVYVSEYIVTDDADDSEPTEKRVSFLTTRDAMFERMRAGDIEWYTTSRPTVSN